MGKRLYELMQISRPRAKKTFPDFSDRVWERGQAFMVFVLQIVFYYNECRTEEQKQERPGNEAIRALKERQWTLVDKCFMY